MKKQVPAITVFPDVKGTRFPNMSSAGVRVPVKSLLDVQKIILKHAWAPGIFKQDVRKNDGFLCAYFMGLDFDGAASVETIYKRLRKLDFDASITLTRNHLKSKNGTRPCDRFRVVIPLEQPVVGHAEHARTWEYLSGHFPEIDPKCKDPARFFFASTNGIWEADNG